ncbi:PAS domain-containing protein [Phenylobacterium sp.]|uniref:PAS domain-containing protein n=1 Tax=Phenylobacterium sp. TaxID=1871053 RepID=UPI0035B37538
MLDHDLRFVSVNDVMLRSLGKTRDEMIGRGYLEVYPQSVGSEVHQALERALRSMAPEKRRLHSQALGRALEMEIFPVAGGLQVAFSLAG